MLELLIRNGTIVDGTGSPGYRGDVGLAGGRIVALGGVDEGARRTIDASGLVVAPGFIDLHTHYDAQIWWDPTLSPSPQHGVTTVVAGNCGFSLAPLETTQSGYLMRMMARVEGIPLAALEAGLPWDWRSSADWFQRLQGRPVINIGFMTGHSAIRLAAMGERAVGEAASGTDLDVMARLLDEAIRAGSMGFSSSRSVNHSDGNGDPVPSRFADHQEMVTLAGVTNRHDGVTLGFIPTLPGLLPAEDVALMADMSASARRRLNWNVLTIIDAETSNHEVRLAAADGAARRGAALFALTLPDVTRLRLSFRGGFVLDSVPGWAELFARPVPERLAMLSSPIDREKLKEGARAPHLKRTSSLFSWEKMDLVESPWGTQHGVIGCSLEEIARRLGGDVLDVLLDVVLQDQFTTCLLAPPKGDDDATWKLRAEVWRDRRTILGGSDAGAHSDMMCGAAYPTAFLAHGVRERQLLSLEEAVHQLTEVPARYLGLNERGTLRTGSVADLVVFDPDVIRPLPVTMRDDLPGGAERLVAEATGMKHVLVDGREILRDDSLTGDSAGHVLRSGIDTSTGLALL